MRSEVILNDVVANLDLNTKWGKKYNNGGNLKTAESAAILKGNLVLAPVRNTSLIAVTVYSEEPKEAAQIANATVDAYKNYRVKNATAMVEAGLHKLQQEFQNNETQVEQTRAEISSIGSQLNVGSVMPANPSPQEQAYWDKKRYLDGLLETHQALYAKIEAAKIEVQLPHEAMVQITDPAMPGKSPVKPNKPLNIFIGAVAGGLVGLLTGAASAFAAAKWNSRSRKNPASV